jgi:hypothetical protein
VSIEYNITSFYEPGEIFKIIYKLVSIEDKNSNLHPVFLKPRDNGDGKIVHKMEIKLQNA